MMKKFNSTTKKALKEIKEGKTSKPMSAKELLKKLKKL